MNASDMLRAFGYMIPYYGTFAQSFDLAQEQKRWNDDFQKNVGKAIRYPMRTGHDLAAIYGRVGQTAGSVISSAVNDLGKSYRNIQKNSSRSLLGFS